MTHSGPGPVRRVVHLLDTLSAGGVERSVLELAANLDPARFVSEVWHLSGDAPLAPAFRSAGIPVRRHRLAGPWDLSVVPRLTFALRHHRADILHTHHPVASAFGRLAAAHAGLGAVVATEHSVTHWSDPGHFVNRLVRGTAQTADCVVCVSSAVEYLARGAGAVPEKRSRVIHDGVSLPPALPEEPEAARTAARTRFGIPAEGPLVATLPARLIPQKGLSTFIETIPLILSERADTWFAIAGEGPERPALEAQARTVGVTDRLFFVGTVLDPHLFLPAVQVFALPSLTEGYGIAGLEAMAHGIPVVGTCIGGIPELLEKEGGLMVNVNAPREMAAVILYLLNSALYSAEIGGAGRLRIAGAGSAARMAGEYMEVYEEALARRR
jgi:glycosyltransferase involved in cell wall biosynthesis